MYDSTLLQLESRVSAKYMLIKNQLPIVDSVNSKKSKEVSKPVVDSLIKKI